MCVVAADDQLVLILYIETNRVFLGGAVLVRHMAVCYHIWLISPCRRTGRHHEGPRIVLGVKARMGRARRASIGQAG